MLLHDRFCKHTIRGGVLPKMLDEIIRTRLMVKSAMKQEQISEVLYRLMNAR